MSPDARVFPPDFAAPVLRAAVAFLLLSWIPLAVAAQPPDDRRQQERLDAAMRREAQAVVALLDDAAAGRKVPADFVLGWHNDFFKADPGTLVPFTISFEAGRERAASALMYVRAARRGVAPPAPPAKGGAFSKYAFDAIFGVDLDATAARVSVTRAFAVPPGIYDVFVAVRERPSDPLHGNGRRLRAGVLKQRLAVPDFWTGAITTSTIMLASRIETLAAPLGPDAVLERPYAVGGQEIVLAHESRFPRDSELIVVFLIYNQQVTAEHDFDVSVDYHVYRRGGELRVPATGGKLDHPPPRPGETYVTRTTPQRFNATTMGDTLDVTRARPVLAGQGILLSSFEEGEYRIGITVTDLLSRSSVSRDVTFTVIGS